MSEIVQQFKAHYKGEMKREATDLGNMVKLKPQKLPVVSAMSHEMAAITLEGCIESLEPLVQEITYTVAEEKSLIEGQKKNIVKLKGKDKTKLELWMTTYVWIPMWKHQLVPKNVYVGTMLCLSQKPKLRK